MKQQFNGYLTQYTGESRDNVAMAKLTIKCKEMSTVKAVLSPLKDADEAIESAYSFIQSNGCGNAKWVLETPLELFVTFDTISFNASLMSLSVKKKMEADGGDSVEYCFNFDKEPTEDDLKLWVSYLKYKTVDDSDADDENTTVVDMMDSIPGEYTPSKKKKKKKKATLIEFPITFDTEKPQE